jgi:serine protease
MQNVSRSVLRVLAIVPAMLFSTFAAADPYGPPFVANTYTPGNQTLARAAAGANGDSVLLWRDEARGNFGFVRRYDAAGRALHADEWYVGADVIDVAVSGTGSYAVLRAAPDGSGRGVFVTVYSRAGGVIVPEFRVNDATAGEQYGTALAMNANGQFAVTWMQPTPSFGYDIFVKRFQANGAPVAPAQLVRTTPKAINAYVAIDAQGNFVVIWDELVTSDNIDVFARRYASTGFALAPAFRVNTFISSVQVSPRIAMNGTGSFVVVWDSWGGADWTVRAQRYSASGTPLGGEFQVSVQPTVSQGGSAAAMAPNGSFVVTWYEDNRTIDPSAPVQVLARGYDAGGTPSGAPFAVSVVDGAQSRWAQIAMDPEGNSTIAWTRSDQATLQNDVYARRFMPVGVVAQAMLNPELVSNISGAAGSWRYFKITVPSGHATLDVSIFGSVGDADLYVRQGAVPTLSRWDGRPFLNGSNESVRMLNWPPGDWYIGVQGFSSYSGLSLQDGSF